MVTSIALVVLVGVARRWSRAWPATAGVLLAGLVMLGSFVYPLLVEPLFNDFEPLPDGPLRTQVLELADQEGVQVDDVLVADASRRTTTLNAYVSGFGSSRRVVVYDNLVDDADDREILSVVAHELGHARHDDVLTGSLLGAAGALLGVGLLGLLVGARELADPRQVPRVLALVAIADAARQPGGERHQPADRDPGRRGLAAGHPGPRGVHRGAETAGAHVAGRPDAVRLVAVLVRQPPDDAAADRAGPTRGQLSSQLPETHVAPLESGSGRARGQCSAVLFGGSGAGAESLVLEDVFAAAVEEAVGSTTEGEDRDDDHGGDAGDQEAVLDGRGTALVAGLFA